MTWTRTLSLSFLAAALATFVLPTALFAAAQDELVVYIGTYTGGASKGIYVYRLDLATGELRDGALAGESVNPSFVAIHPNRKWLYAVGEISSFEGKKAGAVRAFAIDPKTEKLTPLNEQPSGGTGPCHVSIDRTGKYALVANYGSGSAACLPIDDEGRLGEASCVVQHEGSSVNPRRQQGPHAHEIVEDPAGRFVFVPDLGLDKVMVYRFDATSGKMTPNDPAFARVAPGSGPRHIAFHPDGKHAYVINEMGSSITAFDYDPARGVLTTLQTVSTLPEGFDGQNTCAEVVVHPSGKFVYGSNRGDDSIAIFAVNDDGTLRGVGHESTQGKTPRNFAVDPTGTYLLAANQSTDNVVVFRIDQATGKLTPTGCSIEVPSPVCVEMMQPHKQ